MDTESHTMMHSSGIIDLLPMMGPAVGLLLIVICIFAIVGLVFTCRWLFFIKKPDTKVTMRQTPLEIAKLRYARGEIDKEEFDQIKRDLD